MERQKEDDFLMEGMGETFGCIMIDPELLKEAKIRKQKFGTWKLYFQNLMDSQGYFLWRGFLEKNISSKTDYQPDGRGYKRVAFRCFLKDWAQLKALSDFLGMSISKICYFLIYWDVGGISGIAEALRKRVISIINPFSGYSVEYSYVEKDIFRLHWKLYFD